MRNVTKRAILRASARDRKRTPRMRVSGSSVKTLARVIDRPKPARKRKR